MKFNKLTNCIWKLKASCFTFLILDKILLYSSEDNSDILLKAAFSSTIFPGGKVKPRPYSSIIEAPSPPPEKTIGVIYKTSNELRKTIDVRRILALPLSRSEALKSLEKEKAVSTLLKQAQKKLDIEIANNKLYFLNGI